MASELSQLIESELRKAEGANKPDEHQRRLASLRVKTGLEKPPPTLLQRVCTTKRQIIAGGVVALLLVILVVYAAASHRHASARPGSTNSLDMSSSNSRPLSPTSKADILDANNSKNSQPVSPDHLLTDGTEYSEDDTISENAIMTVSPLAEGNYDVISAQADDDSELSQAESQEGKKALKSNLANAGYPGAAPALSQDIQTMVPALAPSLLDMVIPTIQNSTAASAPAPNS